MKVIVASSKTQGQRKNDFFNGEAGELLYFGSECDRGTVDDRCGCKRALSGIKSHRATTTGEVAERDLTDEQIREMFQASLLEAGWLKAGEGDPYGILEGTIQDFKTLCGFAARLEVGTPIERRGSTLRSRIEGAVPAPRRRRSA